MKNLCYVALVIFLLSAYEPVVAQEAIPEYIKGETHQINESYKMFKKILWWRMDLNEKQNLPFFSRNGEISKLIIEAVKQDLLIPYEDDSLNKRMPKEAFLENLRLPDEGGSLSQEEIDAGFQMEEDPFGGFPDDDGFGGEEEPAEPAFDEFSARDFSLLEIKEEFYFDRNRSRMYRDIIGITLVLPADKNPALFEKSLASFKYSDLMELFRAQPDKAVWYNTYNYAENKNYADAFLLQLYSANLIKFANPRDQRIVEIYSKSRKAGIIASQQIEQELLEFENELWEY